MRIWQNLTQRKEIEIKILKPKVMPNIKYAERMKSLSSCLVIMGSPWGKLAP